MGKKAIQIGKKHDQHADTPTKVFGEASEVARAISISHLQS